MNEETVAAASSAEVDVFEGKNVSMEEYTRYRQDGVLPDRLKVAEEAGPAPADTSKATTEGEDPEPEPESDPEDTQELPQKGSGAEKRIKQLLAEKKELQRQIAEKQDVKTESSPAPVVNAPTRPKPTPEDKNSDGSSKYETYEDFTEDKTDWQAEQREVKQKREYEQQEGQKALQSKLEEARTRYEDADEVIFPASQAIQNAQIPQAVKEVFGQSDVFIDLCYVVGSDPEELKRFISLAQNNPRAAIGRVFEYERGIKDELSKASAGKGEAPVSKTTKAPTPPSPVGGASSRAFDTSDESLSPDAWARKRTAEVQRRRG